jgi:hypothetical protein
VKRLRIESPLLMLHKLALCDIRFALDVASRQPSRFLVTQWVNESTLRQSPLVVQEPASEAQIKLIPDASFTLLSRTTGTSVRFYLELDRATVSLRAIRQRVRGYLLRGHHPPPALFVVADTRRQAAITQVALEEAAALKANPTTLWITTKAQITSATVLAAPWVAVGHSTPVTFHSLATPVTQDLVVVSTGGQRA